jgi:mono/diheme cytochrome c family protein
MDMKRIDELAFLLLLMLTIAAGGRLVAQDNKPWVTPDKAKKVENPLPATPEDLQAAAQVYKDNCVLCHGSKGKGDGIAGRASEVPSSNFTDSKLMDAETDGSLFWKLSEGRGAMPPWKDSLSDTERWGLVNYLRKLNKDANPKP